MDSARPQDRNTLISDGRFIIGLILWKGQRKHIISNKERRCNISHEHIFGAQRPSMYRLSEQCSGRYLPVQALHSFYVPPRS